MPSIASKSLVLRVTIYSFEASAMAAIWTSSVVSVRKPAVMACQRSAKGELFGVMARQAQRPLDL
ncbi:MAG: hypothetical protein RLZZ591_2574 [Pseudomonadota bacterium]|jgi:hypothetical protein